MSDYIIVEHPPQLQHLSIVDKRPLMFTQLKSYHLHPNDKSVIITRRQRRLPFPTTKKSRPKPSEKEYRVRRGIIQPGKLRRDMHRYF